MDLQKLKGTSLWVVTGKQEFNSIFQGLSKMVLHLIKMAAGISSMQELIERQEYVRAQQHSYLSEAKLIKPRATRLLHVTRFFPKRRDEILSKNTNAQDAATYGSLYWVFQKRIQARQLIADFIEVSGDDGLVRCGILLEGPLVPVEHHIRKAFQGWRYLPAADAPADLAGGLDLAAKIPENMRRDLQELCLL